MKTSLITLSLVGSFYYGALADGVVKLNNYDSQMPILFFENLAPTDTHVQLLYQINGSDFLPVNLVGTSTSTVQLKEPGYFDAGIGDIPNIDGNTEVTFTIRAWAGSSYEAATIIATETWSQNTMFWDPGTGLPNTGAMLEIPAPIAVVVPEPQSCALFALGGGALFLWRRRFQSRESVVLK